MLLPVEIAFVPVNTRGAAPGRLHSREDPLPRRSHRQDGRNAAEALRRRVLFRDRVVRSEEHTPELQSQSNLVCRRLLEKKKRKYLVTRIVVGALRSVVTRQTQ